MRWYNWGTKKWGVLQTIPRILHWKYIWTRIQQGNWRSASQNLVYPSQKLFGVVSTSCTTGSSRNKTLRTCIHKRCTLSGQSFSRHTASISLAIRQYSYVGPPAVGLALKAPLHGKTSFSDEKNPRSSSIPRLWIQVLTFAVAQSTIIYDCKKRWAIAGKNKASYEQSEGHWHQDTLWYGWSENVDHLSKSS